MPLVNAVYYPSWHFYKGRTPAQIPIVGTTHIYYAFLRLNPNGSVALLDPKADLEKSVDGETGCLRALAALRRRYRQQPPHHEHHDHHQHHHGHHHDHDGYSSVKTLISVGGGGTAPVFAQMAADPASRARFAREIRAFVDEFEFDGVDIDWEHPTTPETGKSYMSLLAALRTALPAPTYLLTTALPVGKYCLGHIDLARAGGLVDMLNLMGYDFHGSWSAVAGHQSQLFPHPPLLPPRPYLGHGHGDSHNHHVYRAEKSCAMGVEYVLSQGFPAHKLILGVPTYAYVFGGASGPGDDIRRREDVVGVDNCHLGETVWESVCVDESIGAAWAVVYKDNEDGSGGSGHATIPTFISLDVPETVRAKARYVREHGLGGLFYWHAFGDCGDEGRSLIRAGRDELDG